MFEFPVKCSPPSAEQLVTFSTLLKPDDLMTTRTVASGTSYSTGQIVVLSVVSEDVIRVGVVLGIVMRKNKLMFVVSIYDAARTRFQFFRACPSDKVDIIDYRSLSDFKPLFKRDSNINLTFFLHHHLPTPIG